MRTGSVLLVTICVLAGAAGAQAQPAAIATDRVGFDQPATSAELALLTWRFVLDGAPAQPLAGVTCAPISGQVDRHACSAPWPAMTPGQHTIAIIARRTEGTLTLDSAPSAPFTFRFVVAPSTPENVRNIRPAS